MKELSVFVDESGDFGEYTYHSPYYIITMVFHDQCNSIERELEWLENNLSAIGFPNHTVHNGPIIRGEEEYRSMDIFLRRKIFNKMICFVRQTDIMYHTFNIEKKHIGDVVEATGKLSKKISAFIKDHYEWFLSFDSVKVYYDNGQVEVNKILSSVCNALLPNVEFRKVIPSDYRLFQVADLLCTFQLLLLKRKDKNLSKSEINFFGNSERDFKKNYLRPIEKKLMK